jgi:TolB-like protein/Tfp pilus assembly protein PilF
MTQSSVRRMFELHIPQRTLNVNGAPAEIGSRAFDVLACLQEHGGRLVSKDVLIAAAWPGRIVEESNLSVQIAALRKVLGHSAIVTVSGRGYRLAAMPPGMQQDSLAFAGTFPIAVLPFSVFTNAPEDALLADGLAADVIALLSRVPGFKVTSSSSSFLFRGAGVERADVASQLSARYLVEGNLRAKGESVRVGANLVDAQTGHVLWSGDFEGSRGQVENLQEGIARGIISQLQPELTRAAVASIRRQRPGNLDSWAHYHQAVSVVAEGGWSEGSLQAARAELRSAITIDPAFGLAHAHYAVLTTLGHSVGLLTSARDIATWSASVDEALRHDGQNSEVLGYAGCALSDMGQHEQGVQLLREAIDHDPSNAQAHVSLGATLARGGELARGIERLQFGMRISPRDRRLGFWGWIAAACLLRDQRPAEALVEARMAAARDPQLFLPRIANAVAALRTNQREEAVKALRRAIELRPQLTLAEVAARHGRQAGVEVESIWPGPFSVPLTRQLQ